MNGPLNVNLCDYYVKAMFISYLLNQAPYEIIVRYIDVEDGRNAVEEMNIPALEKRGSSFKLAPIYMLRIIHLRTSRQSVILATFGPSSLRTPLTK